MRVLLAISLLTLSLAGCTGGAEDPYTTPPQDDQGRYLIEVGGSIGSKFSEDKARVPVGATVLWTNMGGAHNVKADDGSFGNEVSTDAWTFEHTFTVAGEFGYHCVPHRSTGMIGTILVE